MELWGDREVLVCLRYGIGDAVMQLPALDAFRRAVPAAPLVLLGARPAIQLFEGDPRVRELHAQQDFGLEHRWDAGRNGAGAAFGAWLDERRFGLVVDAVHAPPAVGREADRRGIARLDSDAGAESRALEAGRGGVAAIATGAEAGWGIPVARPARPRLPLGPERRWAARYLARRGVEGRAIGLMPSASIDLKRWPVERFAAVGKGLLESSPAPLLLFDAPGDATAAAVEERLRHPRTFRVPVLHLRRTAAVLARCRLFLSNDTGLMHVAAAVRTPVVGIFAATHAGIYLPPGEPHRAVESDRPCPYRRVDRIGPPDCWMHGRCLRGERSCVRGVRLAGVRDAVAAVLKRGAPARKQPA